MSVLISPEDELLKENETRDLVNGVPVKFDTSPDSIVLTKYITTDARKADWRPEKEWVEQVTTDVGGKGKSIRISVPGFDGEPRSVTIHDGLVIDLLGTLSGIVGITPGHAPMNEREAEDYTDATGEPVPRFQKWDFRITKVVKTDGPQAREGLNRSEEQKRLGSEASMFEAFKKMFEMGQGFHNQSGEIAPTADAALKAGIKGSNK
jgi:hypothetical protein